MSDLPEQLRERGRKHVAHAPLLYKAADEIERLEKLAQRLMCPYCWHEQPYAEINCHNCNARYTIDAESTK